MPPMPDDPVLRVHGLTRRFGDRTVVDGLDFALRPGTMTGFLGANGAGKTTTLRMIMGILEPTAGEVLWRGEPLGAEQIGRFGYMPEERGLWPKQRILDQLVYLAQLHGVARAEARERAGRLLEEFGLADRGRDLLESLSLGNQQRVQIAAALIHEPEALILDEPFSGLDPAAVDSMVEMLRRLLHRGVPVLFSSHQLDLVERLCEDVVILHEGTVAVTGSAETLRSAGPARYRITAEADLGWLRDVPELEVLDVAGREALVELPEDPGESERTRSRLLADLVPRGLTGFTRIYPTLSEIYRKATR